ncbi:MAG TPA: hypothetical protein VGW09_06345 [Nitrososphaeraceae archaeon]|jgi:hypothetical protein|nr:hypothetical protein [Nitrososphaeraceae archaeon]HEV2876873.1 hypothetical protein [Nitrososphaeraceae archaeon]
MGILTWIIVAIVILAVLGLGWDNFFAGVKRGADKIGITSLIENATNSATEMAKNASREIIGNSFGEQ